MECKWYNESKNFCKWLSCYIKKELNCKKCGEKNVDNTHDNSDSDN